MGLDEASDRRGLSTVKHLVTDFKKIDSAKDAEDADNG